MRSDGTGFTIWFYIGSILTVYGALILGQGVWSLVWPPEQPPVLHELHAGVWWGGLLFALGVYYCYRFFPRGEG
jgi:hypothetical protein